MPKTRIKTWLLFISCGLLSFVAAPANGMGFVAFFSLIPLLHAVRMTPHYRTNFLGGFLAGAVFFIPALAWFIPVTITGWLALSLYCALYFASFALAARWASRFTAIRSALILASCWVLLEYIRGIVF